MRVPDRHRPVYSLTIPNVPGPQIPLDSLGAKLVATYPMGPINEGAALNITVTSAELGDAEGAPTTEPAAAAVPG